jgi:hypothetical protein
MADLQLFVGNDLVVEVTSLKDVIDDDFINDAAVTADLFDENDTKLGSTITLPKVAGSDGHYRGTIDDATDFIVNEWYWVQIEAVSGNTKGTWRCRGRACYREC